MNIKRYLLPASIAAVLHTAFLLAIPSAPLQTRSGVTGPKKPPEKLVEIAPPPARDPDLQSTEPVKAIPHGEQPVELPEPFASRPVVDFTFEVKQAVYQADPLAPLGPPGRPDSDGPITNVTTPTFPSIELDRTPTATAQIAPNYPSALRQSGFGGEVWVEFVVDTTGRVTSAQVLKSTHREFEDPTLRAVLRWRFEPGKRNNRAVQFRMVVPVTFSLGGF